MAVQDSMTKIWEVAVVGEIFADHIFSGFDRWPQPGEEYFTDHFVREAGGGAAITACALARLNRNTSIFAVMGEKDLWLRQRLLDFGVGLEGLQSVATDTAISIAISTRDDRSFLTWPGANRELTKYLHEPATQCQLAQARHVHLAMPISRELACKLFPLLRTAGCAISLDTGHHRDWLRNATNWQTCAEVDFFLPNEKEAQIITGTDQLDQLIPGLRAKGLERFVLKLGRAGAEAWLDGQYWHATALSVDAVDTTGAGDAFDAGLIDASLDHTSPPEMLARACICGSLSTRQTGALTALPNREELNRFHAQLKQH
jgi:ribokinase